MRREITFSNRTLASFSSTAGSDMGSLNTKTSRACRSSRSRIGPSNVEFTSRSLVSAILVVGFYKTISMCL